MPIGTPAKEPSFSPRLRRASISSARFKASSGQTSTKALIWGFNYLIFCKDSCTAWRAVNVPACTAWTISKTVFILKHLFYLGTVAFLGAKSPHQLLA